MSWRKPQMSKARAVWCVKRREFLRKTPWTDRICAKYHGVLLRMKYDLGQIREAPYLKSVDTNRWFRSCPEQMNIGIKTHKGQSLLLEIAHTLRVPSSNDAYYQLPTKDLKTAKREAKGAAEALKDALERRDEKDLKKAHAVFNDAFKHYTRAVAEKTTFCKKPHFYQQHTRPWRYNLENPDHIRAFYNLLSYSGAYNAGQKKPGAFADLYRMEIGDRRELARWPMSGLLVYNTKFKKTEVRGDGLEIMDVVCEAGERPPKPKICRAERPQDEKEAKRYDSAYAHWCRQMQHGPKRITLRVRRVVLNAHGHEEQAWYLNDAHELDIPLFAINRLAAELPEWWEVAFRSIKVQSQRKFDWRYKLIMSTDYDEVGKYWAKDEHENLEGTPALARMPYRKDVQPILDRLDKYSLAAALDPTKPAHGMFMVPWTDQLEQGSKDFFLRAALYDSGLIHWDPFWKQSSDVADWYIEDASSKWRDRMYRVVQMFTVLMLVRWRKQRAREATDYVDPTYTITPSCDILSQRLVRGPPQGFCA